MRNRWWFLTALTLTLTAFAAVTIAATPPNLKRAIDQQLELVAADPQNPAALNDLGNLMRLAGDLTTAESVYQRALQLAPDRASIRYNYALLLQQQNRREEALETLAQVIELDPEHAWAHYQRGVILAARRQQSAAIDAYATALSIDPDLAFAEVNPHVIENRLLTEAMLRAYGGEREPPQAPSTYEDAARIAALLLPPGELEVPGLELEEASGPGEAAAENERAAARRPDGVAAGSAVPRRAGGSSEAGEAGSDGDRKLTSEDLDANSSVGQADTPAGGRSPITGGVRPGSTYRPPPWTRDRDATGRFIRGQQGRPGATTDEQGGNAGGSPRGVRPGVRSTGQLEIELVLPAERVEEERAG